MDSERIRLFGASRDGSLTIRGGTTGISVQLDELTAGAEKLDALAGDLAAVEQDAGQILDQLCWIDRQPPWSAVPHHAAVRNSQWCIQAVRAEMQRTGSQIRACIRDYEDVEWRANVGKFLGIATAEELSKSYNTTIAAGVPDGRTTESIIALIQMTAPEVRNRTEQEPFVRDALMLLAAKFRPRDITVKQHESLQVELDSSPAGLLERIRQIDARGAGYIEVLEVNNHGEKAYVIVIPGTQPAGTSAGGDNPFDEAGIVEALLYRSQEVNTAVLDGLAAAGAEPGAPVVAVGYSQGGIHAMNLASDPRLRAQYDVKYVLTAGSPVAGIDVDETVNSMHLEHQADWVPGSDGAANPDTPGRVTVTMATPLETGGDKGLGPGHRLTGYQEGARMVAASDDPALRHSTAVLTGVLGAGGVATATRLSLSRVHAPSSILRPQDPKAHERGHGGR